MVEPVDKAPSRRAKLIRRTLTGAALVGAVVALFWTTHAVGDARPVAIVAVLLMLACLAELQQLGSFGRLRLGERLMPTWIALSGILWASIENPAFDAGVAVVGVATVLGVWACWSVTYLFERASAPIRLALGLCTLGGLALTVTLVQGPASAPGVLKNLPWILGAVAALGVPMAWADKEAGKNALLTLALGVWVLFPLGLLPRLAESWGLSGLAALLVLSKVGDIAGYYVGSTWGSKDPEKRPFPNLSPGKTTAGCLGSLVAGGLAGLALSAFGVLPPGRLGVLSGLILGLLLNVVSQAADLLESKVKRTSGVKDSSTWLGASGGFLDVLDSLLLSTPTALLLAPLLLEPFGE